jgi:hypothetical protein
LNPWTDRPEHYPHTAIHRDGHRIGLFPDGWFAYHRDHRWTPPGAAKIGPEPAGPFETLDAAKRFVEGQGFDSMLPIQIKDLNGTALPYPHSQEIAS